MVVSMAPRLTLSWLTTALATSSLNCRPGGRGGRRPEDRDARKYGMPTRLACRCKPKQGAGSRVSPIQLLPRSNERVSRQRKSTLRLPPHLLEAHDAFLKRAAHQQTVDGDGARLTEAVRAVHSLQVLRNCDDQGTHEQ